MTSDASVITKVAERRRAASSSEMCRSARSLTFNDRGQVRRDGSMPSALPWNRWLSMNADNKL